MRELKFRFWNNLTGELEKYSDLFFIRGDGVICSNDAVERHLEAEQYTGLIDKNGKEIYEGDILASNYSTVYKVSYSEPNGRFEMWSEDGCGGSIADDQYTEDFEIEVIGNIHENPELLEQDNAKD